VAGLRGAAPGGSGLALTEAIVDLGKTDWAGKKWQENSNKSQIWPFAALHFC
jgi:hypothetical protein